MTSLRRLPIGPSADVQALRQLSRDGSVKRLLALVLWKLPSILGAAVIGIGGVGKAAGWW